MATDVKSDTPINIIRTKNIENTGRTFEEETQSSPERTYLLILAQTAKENEILRQECRKLYEENQKLKLQLRMHFGAPSKVEAEKWLDLETEELDPTLL